MSETIFHTPKLREHRFDGGSDWEFRCPGCKMSHTFRTGGLGPNWAFNGKVESPSFTPSLRHLRGPGAGCHLFLTDGAIQFCSDSPHELKGKTVPMEEI